MTAVRENIQFNVALPSYDKLKLTDLTTADRFISENDAFADSKNVLSFRNSRFSIGVYRP